MKFLVGNTVYGDILDALAASQRDGFADEIAFENYLRDYFPDSVELYKFIAEEGMEGLRRDFIVTWTNN